MPSSNQKPTLDFNLNIPEFTLMRITPPLMLNPLQLKPLQFDYSNSQYSPFPEQVLAKIGVIKNQKGGFMENVISGMACLSCTACKAMSRDTLMQINSKDLNTIQKQAAETQTLPTEPGQVVDEQKRERYLKMWKSEKKKHLKPSTVKFDKAYKQHHKLAQKEWEQKVKTYFD